jgi:hypothetical protein
VGGGAEDCHVNAAMTFSYLFAHPETVAVSIRHPIALLLLLLVPALIVLARRDFARHRLALWFASARLCCSSWRWPVWR